MALACGADGEGAGCGDLAAGVVGAEVVLSGVGVGVVLALGEAAVLGVEELRVAAVSGAGSLAGSGAGDAGGVVVAGEDVVVVLPSVTAVVTAAVLLADEFTGAGTERAEGASTPAPALVDWITGVEQAAVVRATRQQSAKRSSRRR